MYAPPHSSSADEVLESVDGDLSVDGVKESSQEPPHCPHDYEDNEMVRLPQLTLTLRKSEHTASHNA